MFDTSTNPQKFWDDIYKARTGPSNGQPSAVMERYAAGRNPGTALDLGCARGDDVIWLAKQGWQATGVDISFKALDVARESAMQAGVSAQARFEQCDLAEGFPSGDFDLVSAMFLQTPLEFPRITVLRKAAKAVRKGGLLLITAHQQVAPWSWGAPEARLPDGLQRHAELDLPSADWIEVFVGSMERSAVGPDGQTAQVTDAVVALERR